MTARSDLNRAQQLSAQLDNVNAALAMLNDADLVQTLVFSTPEKAAVAVKISVSLSTLQTMLTTKQTNLTSQLTALGVS